jgi:divalent metal cation (Fe/Co/Zn/Cd) transporter
VALAEDHLNDIVSNLAAGATAAAAVLVQGAWWADPAGAIIISLYIVWRWIEIARAQVGPLCGAGRCTALGRCWVAAPARGASFITCAASRTARAQGRRLPRCLRAQVDKIVGRAAPEEFIEQLELLATEHHEQLEVDVIRAYHFGTRWAAAAGLGCSSRLVAARPGLAGELSAAHPAGVGVAGQHAAGCWSRGGSRSPVVAVAALRLPRRYLVEVEVVLPADMSLADSHDISLELQHKVEALEQVERAFVHCDYQRREEPEHKVERMLRLNSNGST